MLKKFLLTLLILTSITLNASSSSAPKYQLSGIVTSASGEPLTGVAVICLKDNRGTITGPDGSYKIKLSSGEQNLRVDCFGYKTIEFKLTIEANTQRDITLEQDVKQIDAVVVRGESEVGKIKSSIYSVNAIDIAARVGSIQSISDVVKEGVGVRIRRDGGVGSDYDLTLNGMGGNSIRYFLDGVPLDSKGGDFSLDNIPTNLVERIEIYKGVVPSYLGGDALGGAINIITKEDKQNYYDFSVGAGSFNTYKADFNAQIIAPKSGITIRPTLSYNYSKNDYIMKDVRVLNPEVNRFELADCRRFHDSYQSLFGQVEVGVSNKSWADYLYVTASVADINKDIQTGATQDIVYGAATRHSLSTSFGLRYKKDNLFVEGLSLNANVSHTEQLSTIVDTAQVLYYWNGYHRPSSGAAEMSSYPVIRKIDQPMTNVRANLDYKLGAFSNLNLNYLLTATSSEMTQETSDATQGSGTAKDLIRRHFIGLSYSLSLFEDRWQTSAFVKEFINDVEIEEKDTGIGSESLAGFDAKNNVVKFFTSYGLGTRYKFWEEMALKLSYEYSVRLPGVYELLGNGETINPNYSLEPEKSHNYNVSLYGNIVSGLSVFNYEVGAFYRDIHDYIMAVQGAETFRYDNLSNITISGIEAELGYRFNNALQLRANVSMEEATDMLEFKTTDGKPNATYQQPVPNRPTLYGNASASYTFRDILGDDRLMLEYRYEYVKWFYLTWALYGHPDSKSIIPTQSNHSASITYAWNQNRYSLSIDCSNIFDTLLYDNYKLQKPGRAFFCKFRVFLN